MIVRIRIRELYRSMTEEYRNIGNPLYSISIRLLVLLRTVNNKRINLN